MKKGFQSLRRLSLRRLTAPCLMLGAALATSLLANVALPRPARAVEEIRLLVGGPLIFSVSVESLETYAKTGEVKEDLRLFTRFANEEALAGLRQALQTEIPLTVQQVSNLGYSELGEDILRDLGKVVRPHVAVNGDRGLRGAIIGAAAEARAAGSAESWTPLDVLAHYPGQAVDVRLQDLLSLRRLLTTYLSYSEAAIAAIQSRASAEAAEQLATLPEDLTQPGAYPVEAHTLTFSREQPRQTQTGLEESYRFDVDTFLPQGLSQPAPVVIVSHGYSDTKENFSFVGRHLASHGYVVLVPEHVGSDLRFRLGFTDGLLNTAMDPSEFVSRPEEISYLIDRLEQWVTDSPDWSARLDLERIGVVGHSLGGATAQSLAGADFNFERLAETCADRQINLNPSLYLQCQARFLPAEDYRLRDPRITAAISANGISSGLYGPEGMGQIEVPFMTISAARDAIAPSIPEQIHPFFWVNSEEKYLALMPEGSHFSFTPGPDGSQAVSPLNREGTEDIAALIIGEHRDIGGRYFSALNLAFWNVHLKGQDEYRAYLGAGYGEQLSAGEPAQLEIVRSLSPEDITRTYGGEPPIPFFPTLSPAAL